MNNTPSLLYTQPSRDETFKCLGWEELVGLLEEDLLKFKRYQKQLENKVLYHHALKYSLPRFFHLCIKFAPVSVSNHLLNSPSLLLHLPRTSLGIKGSNKLDKSPGTKNKKTNNKQAPKNNEAYVLVKILTYYCTLLLSSSRSFLDHVQI